MADTDNMSGKRKDVKKENEPHRLISKRRNKMTQFKAGPVMRCTEY